jgi:hypothetical protein
MGTGEGKPGICPLHRYLKKKAWENEGNIPHINEKI